MKFMSEAVATDIRRMPETAPREPQSLQETVRNSVRNYLEDLGDHDPNDLYKMVLAEMEKPLLEEVMRWSGYNQCKTAIALGISRGTLRKKLRMHGL